MVWARGYSLACKELTCFLIGRFNHDKDTTRKAQFIGPSQAIEHVNSVDAIEQAAISFGSENGGQFNGFCQGCMQCRGIGHETRVIANNAHLTQIRNGGKSKRDIRTT